MTDLKPIILWGLVGGAAELLFAYVVLAFFWGDAGWVVP